MNDIYRIEGVGRGQRGGLARVRSLRRELEALDPEVLVLHAGDVIYPSLLSNSYDGAQMIDTLNRLDGDPLSFDKRFFVVFGNHEFDKGRLNQAYILADRVRESQFTWLRSNVSFATNTEGIPLVRGPNLQDLAIIEAKGIQIGIFGLTIDIARPQYVLKIHGAKEVARHFSHVLRQQGADLVVALTHLSLEEDVEILRALGSEGPDLIIGGHEHTRQEQKVSVQQGGDGRWVLKADADAVSTLIVHVTPREGQPPFVRFEYRDLFGDSPAPDADINREVQAWRVRHNEQFCGSRKPPEAASCLDEQVGVTAIELVAEERQIRSCETNFGNWIADQALKAFPKARVALINAGSLRLNQNIPPGPVLRRDLEELFPYDNKVSYIEIDDHTLRKAVNHAITGWPGNGRWLQVSGITFAYDVSDPRSPVAEDLNLSSPAVPGSTGGDRIGVVTTDYLLDPKKGDRDGYTMLPELQEGRETKSLIEIAAKGLAAAGEKGINPKVEGRIRQVVERPPCPPSP